MNLLKGTWLLKLLALALALITYIYVHEEIRRADLDRQRRDPDSSYRLLKLTAKSLPVHVRTATGPSESYRLLADQVTAEPQQVVVIGPEALLEEASNAETALIDITNVTKTITRRIPLESVAGIHLGGQPVVVKVTLPIEMIEPSPAPSPASS